MNREVAKMCAVIIAFNIFWLTLVYIFGDKSIMIKKWVVNDTLDKFGVEQVEVKPFRFQNHELAGVHKEELLFEDKDGRLYFEDQLHDDPRTAVNFEISLRERAIASEKETIKQLEALLKTIPEDK